MRVLGLLGLVVGAGLAGCAMLPTAGPTAGAVSRQQVKDSQPQFDLIDIDDKVVATILALRNDGFPAQFKARGAPPAAKIGIGDMLGVSIWEAAGGGLFAPAPPDHGSGGARGVTIPEQVVGTDGAISIPFAGRVPAADHSPVEVQHEIEQRLAGRAIDPQAVVTITKSVANSATVAGEVVNGARVPLSLNGDRLLDLIAAAGGAKAPVYETSVRLSRGGVTATIPMVALVSDPAEDIYAQPGDVLTLVRAPQSFSVFGATGTNAQLNFAADRMSLVEALAKAGGLQDLRSNPAGVFLFRLERPNVVEALGQSNLAAAPGENTPVVYRLDLSNAKSYFLAQRFPLADKDIIYVANADASELQKFLQLLNSLTAPIITGIVVRDATP
jgi:polysaccharide export outer membrane protein